MSQWPTRSSGPLADLSSVQKRLKGCKSHEPVAHSVEWTTSSASHRTPYLSTSLNISPKICYNMENPTKPRERTC
ncbi:hypothetical protein GCWU000182_00788 [Abiotrophia defectiva ATCC 49176]|uniref:Uncharacterized protein n=1 Tax=Abiotrophia defectiva ATCC 49176 TaxID=592010 RepID=W1Q3H3_ABIDE|nr:hypothetical protein GCWU000182_00788 [Abiotrophia defectiva ATCC 49176]